jgi:hypothetical protein
MAQPLVPDDFRGLTEPLRLDLERDGGVEPVELTVESVDSLPTHRLRALPFSLLLSGPPRPVLPQATYALRHPRLGTIDLFIVPLAQDASSARYEATFN